MSRDIRGIPLSTTHTRALPDYEEGLQALRSYTGDPIAKFDAALALAPDFAAAHIAKAFALITIFEQRFMKQALEVLEAGDAAIKRGNAREKTLAAIARKLAGGDWHGGVADLERHLIDYPRDVLAIQVAHLCDFLRGDCWNLRNRLTRVMPFWSANDPEYAYLLGMQAFGFEECNQYPEAEEKGRHALDLQPKDSWALHAVVHVMEMQGRIDEGIAFLEQRRADWAHPDNGFQFHNHWHLALFHVDQARYDKALAIWDAQHTGPALDVAMSRLDATAMLWRLKLEGVDVGSRFEAVADAWEATLEGEAGFYAFNDFHAVLAFAGAGRKKSIERVRSGLRAALLAPGANADMSKFVAQPGVEAVVAYANEQYDVAVEKLVGMRDGASRFGGSHAQRDVLTLTLIDAARRAGQLKLARHYLQERLAAKPQAMWGGRLLSRIGLPDRKAA